MKFFQKINQKMLLLLITSIGFTSHTALAMINQQLDSNPTPATYPQMQQSVVNQQFSQAFSQEQEHPLVAALQAIRTQPYLNQKIESLQTFMEQNAMTGTTNPEAQHLFATILVEVFNDARVAQSYMVQALKGAMQTKLLTSGAKQEIPGMLEALNAQPTTVQQPIPSMKQLAIAPHLAQPQIAGLAATTRTKTVKKHKKQDHAALINQPSVPQQASTTRVLHAKKKHKLKYKIHTATSTTTK